MSTVTQRASVMRAVAWNPTNLIPIGGRGIRFAPIIEAGVLCLLFLAGCSSQVRTESTVTLEEPRVQNGVVVEAEGQERPNLEALGAALDAIELSTPEKPPAAPNEAQKGDPNQPAAPPQAEPTPAKVSVAEAVKMTAGPALPPEATKLLALPKLSRTEIDEIVEHLAADLESSLGYAAGSSAVADALPIPPDGIIGERILAKSGENGTHVLRFGYRFFASQPAQLWAQGVIIGKDNALSANPDLAQVEPKLTQLIASLNAMRANLTVRDLDAKLIQLSYVDAVTAIDDLAVALFDVVDDHGEPVEI